MRQLFFLIALLFLAGCVPPTQNQLRMDMDLEEMKRRLAQLEVSRMETEQSQSAGGNALQRQVAELLAGLDNLRVEFQSINGRLDDLGRDNRELKDDMELIRDDLGLQLNSAVQRIDTLEQNLTSVAGARPPAATVTQPGSVPQAEPSAEQLYQQAIRLIRDQKSFTEGRTLLEGFIARYPRHDLYVNALYWIGEAFYGEKKYEMAILQFQDVISRHADHQKTPAAMLKQALAFNALNDVQNARTTMQKLVDKYPQSDQVTGAQEFLKKTTN